MSTGTTTDLTRGDVTTGDPRSEDAAHSCCEKIWDKLYWRGRPCTKPAKVQRAGSWYCTIHDPERTLLKRAEREAAWEAKRQADRAKYRLQNAAPELLAALRYAVDNPDFDSQTFDNIARAAVRKATNEGAGVTATETDAETASREPSSTGATS